MEKIIRDVSVVIPVYNSGHQAIKAIQSVLDQTESCKEIIVIDDGSKDNSYKLLTSLFELNETVKVYSIKNLGAAGARNYGIDMATGDWVAFLDSDDSWLIDKISCQFRALSLFPNACLLGCLTNMPGFTKAFNKITESHKEINLKDLFFKNWFQTSTVIIKRNVLLSVGKFPIGRRYAEEGDLFMKVTANYQSILINKILVNYSDGKSGYGMSGLSSNIWEMEKGELKNFLNSYKRKDVGISFLSLAVFYSILKFCRRFLIVFIKRFI